MPKNTAETKTDPFDVFAPVLDVEILESGAGRPSTPSRVLKQAEHSLKMSATNMSKAWVAYQNVSNVHVQPFVREWVKAARQLDCGLSRRADEHADGTTTLAFRCQPKRERKASDAG